MLREVTDEVELGGRQWDCGSGAGDAARLGVDDEVADDHGRLHLPQSSQQRIHPCEKFGQHKRFGDVVIGPGGQPTQPVIDPVAGREHHHAGIRPRTDHVEQREPVPPGQHHVQNHHVWPKLGQHPLEFPPVGTGNHVVTGSLQPRLHRSADCIGILDHQHPGGGITSHRHGLGHASP